MSTYVIFVFPCLHASRRCSHMRVWDGVNTHCQHIMLNVIRLSLFDLHHTRSSHPSELMARCRLAKLLYNTRICEITAFVATPKMS